MLGRGLRKGNDISLPNLESVSDSRFKSKNLEKSLYGTKLIVEEADCIIILPKLESISDSNVETCEDITE